MVSFGGEIKRSNATVQDTLVRSSRDQDVSSLARALSLPALLDQLPHGLEWGVLFRTQALVELISCDQLERMLGFPAESEITESVCVALTSAGKCLTFMHEGRWVWSLGGPPVDVMPGVAGRFADRVSMLPAAENADCLGFGQLSGQSPVVMALTIEAGVATAEALFDQRPAEDHYDLLAAVGVRSLGGEWRGAHWCARFSNRLGDHLHAGTLAGFSRTAHCNLFFLNHGRIDESSRGGIAACCSCWRRIRVENRDCHSDQPASCRSPERAGDDVHTACTSAFLPVRRPGSAWYSRLRAAQPGQACAGHRSCGDPGRPIS